jgi:hypothetical protein
MKQVKVFSKPMLFAETSSAACISEKENSETNEITKINERKAPFKYQCMFINKSTPLN